MMENGIGKIFKKDRSVTGSNAQTASEVILCVITDAFLYVSVCALISGLWGDASLFCMTLVGLPFLLLRFLRLINFRVFGIAWLAVTAATVIFIIIFHSSFAGGFKLLANELFDIAESQQGYLYDRFEDTQNVANAARYLCAGFISVLFALGLTAASRVTVRLICASGLFIFSIILCSYFGIGTLFMPVIGILVSLVMIFIISQKISLKAFLIMCLAAGTIIAATTLITWAVSPGKNFAVSETEEKLRDLLAGKTVHYSSKSSDDNDSEAKDDSTDDENGDEPDDGENNELEPPGETGGSINGVTLLFIILAIVVILLILFIPAFFLDKVKKRREKNREGIYSEDNSVAIRSMFLYLMRWFRYKGWCKDNEFFEDAVGDIEKGMSKKYSQDFKKMHAVWQEASFSEKEQSDDTRQKMKDFVNDSIAYLWDQADFKERLKIRFKYAL